MADNDSTPAKPREIMDFFSAGDAPEVKPAELIAFKKGDPDGYQQVADGIGNGSLTY